ncbi:hypothetical protein AMATHDRAFT_75844 [Amanita thiersii Skay4041]|uniref:Enoyl reductase (ER) domain-containing protein n=1 Tax=Amanita thiersii Skay4041 TaxID=703135 RepID=A0A2A9NQR2_9AGAR|nr:hypothetical protein AMATHDRAFT_75844 [Amanita thiersii Skay4041]
MAPSQQKALFLDSKFGKFILDTTDVPKPGPGEILVKVKAAALNPLDWKIQKYGVFIEKFPAILGSDMAGEIKQLGEGVTGFVVGDKVLSQGAFAANKTMFLQQYAIVKPETLAKLPSNMTFEDAATIPLGLTTAYLDSLPNPLISGLNRLAGESLVVLGGSSSVGQFAIQLAKLSGFSHIVVTSSLKHTSFLQSLGATHVLDRNASPDMLITEISKIVGSIKYVFDAISTPETQKLGYSLLASGGRLVLVLPDAVENKMAEKGVSLVFGTVDNPVNQDALLLLYKNITGLLADGAIKPNRVEILKNGLGGILVGLAKMERDLMSGVKLVVKPYETCSCLWMKLTSKAALVYGV